MSIKKERFAQVRHRNLRPVWRTFSVQGWGLSTVVVAPATPIRDWDVRR